MAREMNNQTPTIKLTPENWSDRINSIEQELIHGNLLNQRLTQAERENFNAKLKTYKLDILKDYHCKEGITFEDMFQCIVGGNALPTELYVFTFYRIQRINTLSRMLLAT